MPKLVLTIELPEDQKSVLSQNSVERVFNQARKLLCDVAEGSKKELQLDLYASEDDLDRLQRTTCSLWSAAQQSLFATSGGRVPDHLTRQFKAVRDIFPGCIVLKDNYGYLMIRTDERCTYV